MEREESLLKSQYYERKTIDFAQLLMNAVTITPIAARGKRLDSAALPSPT